MFLYRHRPEPVTTFVLYFRRATEGATPAQLRAVQALEKQTSMLGSSGWAFLKWNPIFEDLGV